MPLVSVVIPFYNGVDWLCEAVDSVLTQTFKDYEIVVVNDGSPEDVTDFLAKYGDKIVYHLKENGGPATARNLGVDVAKGKYIAFLDSDDLWLEKKLEVQIAAMEATGVMWSCCGYRTFGAGNSVEQKMNDVGKAVVQRLVPANIGTPCVVVKKEVFLKHPDCRFNTEMRYGQDSCCWLYISSYYPILTLPDCLAEVRMRGTNAAKRARVQLRARSAMWKRCKSDKELLKRFRFTAMQKIASELCIFGDNIVSKAEKKMSPAAAERLSKMLFVLPWSITKLNRFRRKLYKRRSKQK